MEGSWKVHGRFMEGSATFSWSAREDGETPSDEKESFSLGDSIGISMRFISDSKVVPIVVTSASV